MTLDQYLSQERGRASRLASSLGVSRRYVSEIRNGNRRPAAHIARAIEKETGGVVAFQYEERVA